MKKTLELANPIMVNNKEVCKFDYDTNEINAVHFAEAEARKKKSAGNKNVSISPAAEFDYSLHLYLGFAAIVAVNPSVDFSDLERIHGADLVDIMAIGRNFIMKSEKSEENSSDEQSETTQEPSTQASKS